jgi:ribosomal protein L27
MNARMRILACAAFLVCGAERAYAQGFAVLGGATVNPDQVYGGAQYESRLTDTVWLQPSADIGVGNDATLFSVNGDVTYRRLLANRSPWQLAMGGGPSINIYRLPSYTTTTAGVGLLAGLQHASGLFTEFRVGLARDDPDFRLSLGYHFGMKTGRTATHSKPRRH